MCTSRYRESYCFWCLSLTARVEMVLERKERREGEKERERESIGCYFEGGGAFMACTVLCIYNVVVHLCKYCIGWGGKSPNCKNS